MENKDSDKKIGIYASTAFLILGVFFYPYPGFDLGYLLLKLFGLNSDDAGTFAIAIAPVALILAFVSSLIYGAVFLFRRKQTYRFLIEAVLAFTVFWLLPVY